MPPIISVAALSSISPANHCFAAALKIVLPIAKPRTSGSRRARTKDRAKLLIRHVLAKDDDTLNMRVMLPSDITGARPEGEIGYRFELPPVRLHAQIIHPLDQREDLFRSTGLPADH